MLDDQDYQTVAIIGQTGRFPGASDVDTYWQKIVDGEYGIQTIDKSTLSVRGVDRTLLDNPEFIRVDTHLASLDMFDAAFFGINPREAKAMDPQHRMLLEETLNLLRNSAISQERFTGDIGLFAGVAFSQYFLHNIACNPAMMAELGDNFTVIGNHLSYACTRVANHFNFTGPVIALDTACSSSLLSVHMACKSLLNYECDLAIAGGVQLNMPQFSGYLYEEGGFRAPDGKCKTFDAEAQGTVFGSGLGLVALRRLDEALEEGDNILALIRGSATNNDGNDKVGFTAPSVSGQRRVVEKALAFADIDAASISYVEAHGTGTPLGDSIELRALSEAYSHFTDNKQYCAIGSLKPAFSHMETAAGIAGLIKTALMLRHKVLPGVLNYQTPNPKVGFENTPFYVNVETRDWPDHSKPRRAAVSAFGIGGTNAHVILEEYDADIYREKIADHEEAPNQLMEHVDPGDEQSKVRPHLLMLSAKNIRALQGLVENTVKMIPKLSAAELTSLGYHLQHSTPDYSHRFCAVAADNEGLTRALNNRFVEQQSVVCDQHKEQNVVFMFPGQGCQYVEMGKELYECEPVFQEQLNLCLEIVARVSDHDAKSILFPENDSQKAIAHEKLSRTETVQPIIFAFEYALAQLWMSKGIKPVAYIGHSLGEYVAACLSGVFSLQDAIKLICSRARLMQLAPEGAMTAVAAEKPEVLEILAQVNEVLTSDPSGTPILCEISAENADTVQVVSGSQQGISALEKQLESIGIHYARLKTQHAYHSSMMDQAANKFLQVFEGIRLNKPTTPFVSCVTGDWIQDHEAMSPNYWSKQIRQKVNFVQALKTIVNLGHVIFLEVGPGQQLKSLVVNQRHIKFPVIISLPVESQKLNTLEIFTKALGQCWQHGIEVDWDRVFGSQARPRLPLPAYAFDRQSYWVNPAKPVDNLSVGNVKSKPTLDAIISPLVENHSREDHLSDWFQSISWQMESLQTALTHSLDGDGFVNQLVQPLFVVFDDGSARAKLFIEEVQAMAPISVVKLADQFSQTTEQTFCMQSGKLEQMRKLFQALEHNWRNAVVEVKNSGLYVANFWPMNIVCKDGKFGAYERSLDFALIDTMNLAKVCAELPMQQVRYCAISHEANSVTGLESIQPFAAMLETACKVIGNEFKHWSFAYIDSDEASLTQLNSVLASVFASDDVFKDTIEPSVVLRQNRRWKKCYKNEIFVAKNDTPDYLKKCLLKKDGVYLITGGLGGIGYELASYLAKHYQAKLIIVGRSDIPARDRWHEFNSAMTEVAALKDFNNIEKIRHLESLGATVIPVTTDISDYPSLQSVFGRIDELTSCNGVFHCAGISHSGAVLFTEKVDVDSVMAAKVKGAINLNRFFADADLDKPLDFVIYFSSLWSVVGAAGHLAYASANRFLDALAWSANQDTVNYCRRALAINWSGWAKVGMAAHFFDDASENAEGKSEAIYPEQGIEALERVLIEATGSQVIIGPDVKSLLRGAPSSKETGSKLLDVKVPRSRVPSSVTNKIKFGNKQKQQIADIWKEVLGLENIDPEDNFFDIGGTSLLLSEVLQKIKQRIDAKVKIIDLLNHPTIRTLSVSLLPSESTEDDLDEITARANKRKAQHKKRGHRDSL